MITPEARSVTDRTVPVPALAPPALPPHALALPALAVAALAGPAPFAAGAPEL
jgi:hypothetical protein